MTKLESHIYKINSVHSIREKLKIADLNPRTLEMIKMDLMARTESSMLEGVQTTTPSQKALKAKLLILSR
ncbi:hypothetical protein C442_03041 [Haloarcula amylolytica JCM 13557]|uniref:Uncharacterized protein n=1 Tax=Haloarcula amylolytica JCM 13557 TaxID=1227452 RepID=M0L063_9EURY|nr:hypothetical protein C442_03041 [Haloarcula amylolytica JCM 13557]